MTTDEDINHRKFAAEKRVKKDNTKEKKPKTQIRKESLLTKEKLYEQSNSSDDVPIMLMKMLNDNCRGCGKN